MKTKNVIITVFALCASTTMFAKKQTVTFSVDMDCKQCQQKIEKNIAFEKGVKDLNVSLEKDLVTVTYDDSKTTIEELQKGLKKIGYDAIVVEKPNTEATNSKK